MSSQPLRDSPQRQLPSLREILDRSDSTDSSLAMHLPPLVGPVISPSWYKYPDMAASVQVLPVSESLVIHDHSWLDSQINEMPHDRTCSFHSTQSPIPPISSKSSRQTRPLVGRRPLLRSSASPGLPEAIGPLARQESVVTAQIDDCEREHQASMKRLNIKMNNGLYDRGETHQSIARQEPVTASLVNLYDGQDPTRPEVLPRESHQRVDVVGNGTQPASVHGEPINPLWGVTKAGTARKRLPQACL